MLHRLAKSLPLAAATVALLAASAIAQLPVKSRSALWVGTPLDEYVRLLQLTGEHPLSSRLLRPLEYESRTLTLRGDASLGRNPWRERYGASQGSHTGTFALELYEPLLLTTANSAVPFGTNDGAMWAGKGVSASLTAGAAMRAGPLTVRLAPVLTWSQNAEFTLGELFKPLPGTPPYADPNAPRIIDMPQRFGDAAYTTADLGESSIQLNGRGARAGVSTANMWWGPGVDNSILMSNNAGGFPHAFVGTERALNVRIGRLEALYIAGRLSG
ncbi:MAG: hypothetical protein H0X64_15035, partial [Gemmatimonadaceae bacterium]|nr:hypothetical protein [Gemmatimonadaceae bacterium]